jgi:hypothetical protein
MWCKFGEALRSMFEVPSSLSYWQKSKVDVLQIWGSPTLNARRPSPLTRCQPPTANKQQPTANNNKQQQTTANNSKQQQTTHNKQTTNSKQHTTTSNSKQQQTTTNNKHTAHNKQQQQQQQQCVLDVPGFGTVSFRLEFSFNYPVKVN